MHHSSLSAVPKTRGFTMKCSSLAAILPAALALASVFPPVAHAEDPETGVRLRLSVLADGIGLIHGRDSEWVGTKGQAKKITGLGITIDGPIGDLGIRYRFHVEGIGDTDWQTGFADFQGKRIEGIAIELTGAAAAQYEVLYQGHIAFHGDSEAAYKDGFFCGTRGESRRLEAIVVVVKKRK
jgi:hypothetical protein